jgi:hypothetical protein
MKKRLDKKLQNKNYKKVCSTIISDPRINKDEACNLTLLLPDERYCHRRLVKEMILSINQSYVSSTK